MQASDQVFGVTPLADLNSGHDVLYAHGSVLLAQLVRSLTLVSTSIDRNSEKTLSAAVGSAITMLVRSDSQKALVETIRSLVDAGEAASSKSADYRWRLGFQVRPHCKAT